LSGTEPLSSIPLSVALIISMSRLIYKLLISCQLSLDKELEPLVCEIYGLLRCDAIQFGGQVLTDYNTGP
jgi:hypothetical protein